MLVVLGPMTRYCFLGMGHWPQCLCMCVRLAVVMQSKRRWLQQQCRTYGRDMPPALMTISLPLVWHYQHVHITFFAGGDGKCLLHEASLIYSSQQSCCLHTVQCEPRAQNGIWWWKATWAIHGDLSNLRERQRDQFLLCWPAIHPTLENNKCGMRHFI